MFKMFTQFHNFMEVHTLIPFSLECKIFMSLVITTYTIRSLHEPYFLQVEYLPVVYPPEIKQENALHFAENVILLDSK